MPDNYYFSSLNIHNMKTKLMVFATFVGQTFFVSTFVEEKKKKNPPHF